MSSASAVDTAMVGTRLALYQSGAFATAFVQACAAHCRYGRLDALGIRRGQRVTLAA